MATGSSMGKYLCDSLLNWVKGTAFPASPADLFVALYTVSPDDDSASGTEVSGGAYARVAIASTGWSAITNNDAAGTTGSGEVISNAAVVSFPTPTAAWGTVVGFALYDALTAGNEALWAPLSASKVINSGDTVSFAAGALTITFD